MASSFEIDTKGMKPLSVLRAKHQVHKYGIANSYPYFHADIVFLEQQTRHKTN